MKTTKRGWETGAASESNVEGIVAYLERNPHGRAVTDLEVPSGTVVRFDGGAITNTSAGDVSCTV